MTTSIKTIRLPLVKPKKEVCKEIDRVFKEFRWVYDEASKRLPSLPKDRIKHPTSSTYYEWVKEFRREGRVDLPAQVVQEAVLKARESYASMLSNETYDGIPRSHNDVVRFNNQCFEIKRFGDIYLLDFSVKAGWVNNRILIPFEDNNYSKKILRQVIDEELDYGASELKQYDDSYWFNLTIKEEVELGEKAIPVGVDFGLRNIAVACVWSKGKANVKLWSGKRGRYKRKNFLDRKSDYQHKGLLRKVRETRTNYREYMKTKNHQVSREIIDFALDFFNPFIVLEDLHKFRKQNDWTFAELRTFIEYKALDANIPVIAVDPKNTSNMCNKCKYTSSDNRDGIIFKCLNCGYEVNADVNAAINLAKNIDRGGV